MINIFKKKEYLKDALEGFIDIHNHVLPGIDDGAADVETSINLVRKFKSLGINDLTCTPHIMNDYYPNTPETINNAMKKLQMAIKESNDLIDFKISAAAEYMMDQSFLEKLDADKILTLKDNYVLVEMSYFQPPINLKEILFQLQTRGYRPVLAHPERYSYYHGKDLRKYEDLKNRGCIFQINALSLSNHYGTGIQRTTFQLLDAGMADLIGTDTHREQHLEKLEGIRIDKKMSPKIKKLITATRETFTS